LLLNNNIIKPQTKAYIFALTAVLLWSTVATAFKLALAIYDFFQVLFISSGVATFFLFIILILQKKLSLLFQIPKKERQKLVIAGLLNPFLYYIILFKAYSLLPAQIAQSLNYTWPIVLVIFSLIAFHQKLKPKTAISFLLGFLGVLIISFKGQPSLPPHTNFLGILLAIGSSLIWASFWIIKTTAKTDILVSLFVNFLIGFIASIATMFIFSSFPHYDNVSLAASIYAGLFEMGVTFLIWMLALKLSSSVAKISNLIFLSPFLSLIFISLILNEKILISTVTGLAVIIIGILTDKITFRKAT